MCTHRDAAYMSWCIHPRLARVQTAPPLAQCVLTLVCPRTRSESCVYAAQLTTDVAYTPLSNWCIHTLGKLCTRTATCVYATCSSLCIHNLPQGPFLCIRDFCSSVFLAYTRKHQYCTRDLKIVRENLDGRQKVHEKTPPHPHVHENHVVYTLLS